MEASPFTVMAGTAKVRMALRSYQESVRVIDAQRTSQIQKVSRQPPPTKPSQRLQTYLEATSFWSEAGIAAAMARIGAYLQTVPFEAKAKVNRKEAVEIIKHGAAGAAAGGLWGLVASWWAGPIAAGPVVLGTVRGGEIGTAIGYARTRIARYEGWKQKETVTALFQVLGSSVDFSDLVDPNLLDPFTFLPMFSPVWVPTWNCLADVETVKEKKPGLLNSCTPAFWAMALLDRSFSEIVEEEKRQLSKLARTGAEGKRYDVVRCGFEAIQRNLRKRVWEAWVSGNAYLHEKYTYQMIGDVRGMTREFTRLEDACGGVEYLTTLQRLYAPQSAMWNGIRERCMSIVPQTQIDEACRVEFARAHRAGRRARQAKQQSYLLSTSKARSYTTTNQLRAQSTGNRSLANDQDDGAHK